MKKISIFGVSFLSMIALSTVLFFNSCETDACKDVVCVNGNCVDGSCICDTGYEGTDCSTEERAKFLDDAITVTEDCSASAPASYTVSIIPGSTISEVKISNMWNAFVAPVVATVDGTTISIANQEPDADGFTVQGSGTISNGVISMNYTVTDLSNGDQDNCTSSVWTL